HGAAPDVLREADAGDRRPGAGAVPAVAVAAARHAGKCAAGAGVHHLAEDGRPVLEPDDLVLGADRCGWLKARQVSAAVDAVDHLLQLDGVAALGIEALIGVTELAQADLPPAAAMLGQRLVTAVALRRGGDLSDRRDRSSGRHEVEEWVRVQVP